MSNSLRASNQVESIFSNESRRQVKPKVGCNTSSDQTTVGNENKLQSDDLVRFRGSTPSSVSQLVFDADFLSVGTKRGGRKHLDTDQATIRQRMAHAARARRPSSF